MFLRLLRKTSNIASKLENQKLVSLQKFFCDDTHFFDHNGLEEISEDCDSKSHLIDESAQKVVDKMIIENPEIGRLKKIVELEYEVMKQTGEQIPNIIRPRDWEEILKLHTENDRK